MVPQDKETDEESSFQTIEMVTQDKETGVDPSFKGSSVKETGAFKTAFSGAFLNSTFSTAF